MKISSFETLITRQAYVSSRERERYLLNPMELYESKLDVDIEFKNIDESAEMTR